MAEMLYKFTGKSLKKEKKKFSGEIENLEFRLGEPAGKGAFSVCYKCIDVKSNEIYLAKEIEKAKFSQEEIEIHKSLRHENIVSFQEYIEYPGDENNYLIIEFCANKDLLSLIKKRGKLTEIEVQYYITQLIHALIYLHSNNIIHRDLKPGNIFLDEHMKLKLGDFGLARHLYRGDKITDKVGTLNYMAPEIIEANGYYYEVDIWAVGIIIYQLIIGVLPFKGDNNLETENKIKEALIKYPENAIISNAAEDLIKQILVKDPKERPSLRQILEHDFFTLGRAIPKLIPLSFLDKEPSMGYIKNFLIDANENGIVNREVVNKNLRRIKFDDDTEKTDNFEIYVKDCIYKYIDKYGIAYRLNNDNIGVYYNDTSKIIYNPRTNIYFYMKSGPSKEHTTGNINDKNKIEGNHDLEKKVKLLQAFIRALTKNNTGSFSYNNLLNMNFDSEYEGKENETPIYVKKYYMFDHNSILLRFSNKNIQIYFLNHESILLSNEQKELRIFSRNKYELKSQVYDIEEIMESQNYSVIKKLQYTKSLLEKVIANEEKE